ncbi:MAG: class A beta-lactamase [Alphaproteobacteria bacterium]|nr:class A beta-lactamase [Alphaproteobacteria bacterium]
MNHIPTRRAVLAGCAAIAAFPAHAQGGKQAMTALRALETRSGARIGVAAVDSANGHAVFWREAERFVMCSTFKLSLTAAVLSRAGKNALSLDTRLHYPKPVLGHSPATTQNLAQGMTIAQLCEAAMIYSDNTAANLLLEQVGGPQAVTAFWRSLGDRTGRLDDNEPKLNVPDGERNTTTPAAMMADLKMLLLGDVLAPASRTQLLDWMHANTTGGTSLKAGLPADWRIGDKTGAGFAGTGIVNDIGIITPPGRKPVLAAVYSEKSGYPVLAEVGRILASAFA